MSVEFFKTFSIFFGSHLRSRIIHPWVPKHSASDRTCLLYRPITFLGRRPICSVTAGGILLPLLLLNKNQNPSCNGAQLFSLDLGDFRPGKSGAATAAVHGYHGEAKGGEARASASIFEVSITTGGGKNTNKIRTRLKLNKQTNFSICCISKSVGGGLRGWRSPCFELPRRH